MIPAQSPFSNHVLRPGPLASSDSVRSPHPPAGFLPFCSRGPTSLCLWSGRHTAGAGPPAPWSAWTEEEDSSCLHHSQGLEGGSLAPPAGVSGLAKALKVQAVDFRAY